ncbi:SMP-30/gluconolactonase/LRE family protein [Catalinimonas niigatensis]|uniref:SMP-30/gluconolactonase/LRE family protein n=1 Tax=Catalinimonas niigatensis TaxID=1397264 RepID=UPI002665638A|nr:SMP-30/gluconolactonase/LRE family protein [Catalinimonas niigatensis]WPP52988.1 SMP-30/gluconolactonase/LRE family protein [Catalinimonas niigatensis]
MRKIIIISISIIIGMIGACTKATNDMEVKRILDTKALLGEGPIWNYETQQLYWVDIEKRQLHLYTPEVNEDTFFDTGERIGTVVPIESGGALVALENGIHSMDLTDGSLTLITNPLEDSIRFNDGKCDPVGRFWVGSMHLKGEKNAASLYMMDDQQQITQKLDSVTVSNGIIWSLDNKTMYYIDTPTRQVRAFDYDISTGELSSPSVVITVPQENGAPDGMTIDEEGMLWIGHWGGSMVGRYNPETGELMQKIEVPALNVTACAFGGENLDKLYITTASIGMSEEQQQEYPQAGGLFVVEPGVKGVPADFYRGLKNG